MREFKKKTLCCVPDFTISRSIFFEDASCSWRTERVKVSSSSLAASSATAIVFSDDIVVCEESRLWEAFVRDVIPTSGIRITLSLSFERIFVCASSSWVRLTVLGSMATMSCRCRETKAGTVCVEDEATECPPYGTKSRTIVFPSAPTSFSAR